MKIVLSAILLSSFTVPAWAADAPRAPGSGAAAKEAKATTETPPAPPPPTWTVTGYQWLKGEWVKQADHCLSTTDLKQAADYANEVNRFAGWMATSNVPPALLVDAGWARGGAPPRALAPPEYSVWAFSLKDGKWVKSQKHSWSSPDPAVAWQYAQTVDAVAGWRTTTNIPELLRTAPTGGNGAVPAAANGPLEGYGVAVRRHADGGATIQLPFMSLWLPPGVVQRAASAESSDSADAMTYDNSSAIQDSLNLQNSIATQDMINNQTMNDNMQEMLNTQNMIDTQNMVNNQLMNDNIQNEVNEQNMINAMNQ